MRLLLTTVVLLIGCDRVTDEDDLVRHIAASECAHLADCSGGNGWRDQESDRSCIERTFAELQAALDTDYARPGPDGLTFPCRYRFRAERIERCLESIDAHYAVGCGLRSLDAPWDVCGDPMWDMPWLLSCEAG